MSDPVTNIEVEDVLSSIRRLVSDDKRPSLAVDPVPLSDRLVLTPALRVAHDKEQPENTTVQEPVLRAWSEFGSAPAERDLEGQAESNETDTLDERAGDDVAEHKADDVQSDSEVHLSEDEQTENEAKSGAVLESLNENVDDQNHEDLSSEAVEPETFILDTPAASNNEETLTKIPEAELIDEPSGAAFFTNSAETLTAKIAALETVIGKTDDQWEPDDTGDSDYSGTEAPAMIWDDAESADTTPKADASPQNAYAQSADDILDEEALRDIVSDIVREELQGALGERITRNVRKLVRREIHRALAAQELE